jgi:monoamine oxidase
MSTIHIPKPIDKSPDLVVIGAGLAGLTHAHEAKRQGKSVVLLEKSDRAGGVICSNMAPIRSCPANR